MARYKDHLGNIYGDIEVAMSPESILLELESSEKYLTYKVGNVDKHGEQKCSFQVADSSTDKSRDIVVECIFMKEKMASLEIKIIGLSLDERRRKFEVELSKVNKGRSTLKVTQDGIWKSTETPSWKVLWSTWKRT